MDIEAEELEKAMKEYLINLGVILDKLRGNEGYEKFSERIGMSRDSVVKLLGAKLNDLKLSTLIKISYSLDKSLDDLLGLNVKREPLSTRLEVKTIMENLFLAYQAANLFVQEDVDTGQLFLVINDEYIKEFIVAASDREASTMDDIRSIYSELYGDKNLFMYDGRIVEEKKLKDLMMKEYIDYHKQHAHFNDYEEAYEEDLIEQFNKEYMEKESINEAIEWGKELLRKHHEVINFFSKPSKWNGDLPPEWKSLIE